MNKMKKVIQLNHLKFREEVQNESKERIMHCYQCGKCTAGCPVTYAMDYTPNQIMRMIQLGMEQDVLTSRTIWLCATCYTCTVRCPHDINLAKVMDTLRIMALRKNIVPKGVTQPIFNKIFLSLVRKYGRVHEIELIALYNLFTGNFFKDVLKGIKMFIKAKLNIFPSYVKSKEIKKIFNI
jgi:heterodisulfide reductase subunit C